MSVNNGQQPLRLYVVESAAQECYARTGFRSGHAPRTVSFGDPLYGRDGKMIGRVTRTKSDLWERELWLYEVWYVPDVNVRHPVGAYVYHGGSPAARVEMPRTAGNTSHPPEPACAATADRVVVPHPDLRTETAGNSSDSVGLEKRLLLTNAGERGIEPDSTEKTGRAARRSANRKAVPAGV